MMAHPATPALTDRSPGGHPAAASTGGHDGAMKRSTAIGHLAEMAEVASERVPRRESSVFRWPLEQLWVAGDLLGPSTAPETSTVVLVLDLPAEQLPWLALDTDGEAVGEALRLGKRPFLWCYRPLAWPVWNHQHRRLARFWTASEGVDQNVIDALRAGALDQSPIAEPTDADLAQQLRVELDVSRGHLRSVLHSYWDHEWRREHKGGGVSPEGHLSRAATAVQDIEGALQEVR
jgi:hypothetical protein